MNVRTETPSGAGINDEYPENCKIISRRDFVKTSVVTTSIAASSAALADNHTPEECDCPVIDGVWPEKKRGISWRCTFTLRLISTLNVDELFENEFRIVLEKAICCYPVPEDERDPFEVKGLTKVQGILDTINEAENPKVFTIRDLFQEREDRWDSKFRVPDLNEAIDWADSHLFTPFLELPNGPSNKPGKYRDGCKNFFNGKHIGSGNNYRRLSQEFAGKTVRWMYTSLMKDFSDGQINLIQKAKTSGILRMHDDVRVARGLYNKFRRGSVTVDQYFARKAESNFEIQRYLDKLDKRIRRKVQNLRERLSLSSDEIALESFLESLEKGKCALYVGGAEVWKCVDADNDDHQCEITGTEVTAGSDICP